MKNRISHLLRDWDPMATGPAREEAPTPEQEPHQGPYAMPRGINMLMPVELCINRDLLISLLSASIQEIYRHKRALPRTAPDERELAEVEAALQQQLAFRAWARSHPGSYISIAMYPITEANPVEDLEDLGEF
jgi:hypothetical protein